MRKIILSAIMLVSLGVHGQDAVPKQPKLDSVSGIELKDNTYVIKEGYRYSYSGKTYTEIYNVLTDSMVYRFGLEFRSSDSTFIRKVPMDGCVRNVYNMMKATTEWTLKNQETARKETVEFLNRYRTSPEVWFMFKIYGVLK